MGFKRYNSFCHKWHGFLSCNPLDLSQELEEFCQTRSEVYQVQHPVSHSDPVVVTVDQQIGHKGQDLSLLLPLALVFKGL